MCIYIYIYTLCYSNIDLLLILTNRTTITLYLQTPRRLLDENNDMTHNLYIHPIGTIAYDV